MIPIRINGKKKSLKPFKDITVKEYIDLAKRIEEKKSFDILDYISIILNVDYEQAMNYEIKNLNLIIKMIGEMYVILGNNPRQPGLNYIEDIKPNFYFSTNNKIYDLRKYKTNRVGHRIIIEKQIEQEKTYLELYIYSLALVLSDSFDYDEIEEMKEKLYNENALKVLSLGAFFFDNILNSESYATKIFKRFLRKLLIKIFQ